MRLGILTFHRAFNTGALLQAFALAHSLKDLGHEVVFPDCHLACQSPRFPAFLSTHSGPRKILSLLQYLRIQVLSLGAVDRRRSLHRKFVEKYLPTQQCSVARLPDICDAVIVGSDQVWNPQLIGDDAGVFLGDELPPGLPRIAYAASIGDTALSPGDEKRLLKAAKGYASISMREVSVDVRDRAERGPALTCDPSLLLGRDDYLDVAAPRRMHRGRYVLFYVLSLNRHIMECAEKVGRLTGLDVVILSMYQASRYKCPPNVVIAFGPSEWLAYFRDAECVVAKSFHGTAFSVIFEKPFVSLRETSGDFDSRPGAFLRNVGMPERLVGLDCSVDSWVDLLSLPIGDQSKDALGGLRHSSLSWLKAALAEIEHAR